MNESDESVSYLKETNNKVFLKEFVIFGIINMILLSTLYVPYSLEWGVEIHEVKNDKKELMS